MSVLLTGASGFIGGHLHSALRDRYHVDVYEGDLSSRSDWKPYRRDYDALYHLGAMVGTADSMERPGAYARSNVLGTARLIEAMRGRVGRIVLASSSAVYGECDRLHEDAPHAPQSVYGVTKSTQEELCRVSAIPTVALRLFGVYGPRQDNPHGGVVGMLARSIQEDGRATVFGDGYQLRDFVHVSDVCEAFLLAHDAPAGAYNIGTGVATSVMEVAARLSELLGAAPPVVTGQERRGDSQVVVADPTKALAQMGWKAQVSVGEGLALYASWVRLRG